MLSVLALAAGAMLSFHWMYEPDMGWHLGLGREIAAGHWVNTNLFSAAYPNYPQPYQSWLFELLLYGLWSLGGAAAIQSGQALLIAVTLVLVYLACRYSSPPAAAVAVITLGVFLVEPRAVPRPHLTSLLLGAVCILLIERTRATRSLIPLACTIPVIALWANLHAECLFGAGLIGLFVAGEFLKPSCLTRSNATRAAGIAALAALATLASPFGTGLFQYLLENSRTSEFVQVAEFRPAYLPTYAPFFAYLVCGVALLLWKRRSVALWEMLVFAAFGLLALRHVRFVALFFPVTAPIVARALTATSERIARSPLTAAAALVLSLMLTPVPLQSRWQLSGIGPAYLQPPTLTQGGAAAFIRSAGLNGPVFNSGNLGGYLIFNNYPAVRVFQDTRFQSYPPEHFRSIVSAFSSSQQEWDKLVAGVDWAVLTRERNTALTGYGKFPPDQWASVYQDESILIVVRRTGKFAALAAAP